MDVVQNKVFHKPVSSKKLHSAICRGIIKRCTCAPGGRCFRCLNCFFCIALWALLFHICGCDEVCTGCCTDAEEDNALQEPAFRV